MRVLITGGAGCLGANLVEHLLARGDEVSVIDTFTTSVREALPPAGSRLRVVAGSVTDAALVKAEVENFRPEAIIHAAASYKDPDDWAGDLEVNAAGTLNVVRAAEAAGGVRFLNLQTALCYGRPDVVPVAIDAPLRPFTSYGVSKVAGELYVLASGLDALSFRIANVTGPRLSIGPMPAFYSRLKAGKACFCSDTVRDFLDMQDFIRLIDLALVPGGPRGVFHASSGEGHSIREVYDGVYAYLGAEAPEPAMVPPGADDVASVVLDPSGTEAAFGWKAEIGFSESLRRMLAWYDVNGVHAVYAHVRPPEGYG
jgi:nucleoside-diphosphate-sugar epimerase